MVLEKLHQPNLSKVSSSTHSTASRMAPETGPPIGMPLYLKRRHYDRATYPVSIHQSEPSPWWSGYTISLGLDDFVRLSGVSGVESGSLHMRATTQATRVRRVARKLFVKKVEQDRLYTAKVAYAISRCYKTKAVHEGPPNPAEGSTAWGFDERDDVS